MQIDDNVRKLSTALSAESPSYGVSLTSEVINRIAAYYQLLERWNPRLHLVAPCSPEEFATRHVLESLFLLNYLSPGATVIDVGSGAGLPLLPCVIARPDLRVTLIESSKRKTVFLREALKHTGTEKFATVVAERFENVLGLKSDFVTCRALDRFVNQLAFLIAWSPSPSLLLYGGDAVREKLLQLAVNFAEQLLPNATRRFLFIVRRE